MSKMDMRNQQFVINVFRALRAYNVGTIDNDHLVKDLINLQKIYFDDMVRALEDSIHDNK